MNGMSGNNVFASCFDADLSEEEKKSFWRKVVDPDEIAKILAMPIIHTGMLFRGKGEVEKLLTFTMKPGLLYYGNGKEIQGIVKLTFQKIETFQTQSVNAERIYGIKMFSGPSQTKLFSVKRDEILEWYKILGKYLINRDFFSRYELKEILGEGGFSQVYKIIEKKTGKLYAGKVIKHKMIFSDRRGVLLMKQEIDIMRQVDHPNVVKLIEVQEVHNAVIIVMEYVEGQELKKSNLQLSWRDILQIMKSLISVVAHLEKLGIVHRDLKPSNVMLAKAQNERIGPNTTKVFDFGLSAYLSEKLILTKCGTPGYIAPEVLQQTSKDRVVVLPSIDVYSLGIMFYEMVYKCNPFKDTARADSKKVVRKNASGAIDFNKATAYKNEMTPGVLKVMQDMTTIKELERPLASQLLEYEIFKETAGQNVKRTDYTTTIEENVIIRLSKEQYKFKTNKSRFRKDEDANDRFNRFRPSPLKMDALTLSIPEVQPINSPTALELLSPVGDAKRKLKYQAREELKQMSGKVSLEELDTRFKAPKRSDSPPIHDELAALELEQTSQKNRTQSSLTKLPANPPTEANRSKSVFVDHKEASQKGFLVLHECALDSSRHLNGAK